MEPKEMRKILKENGVKCPIKNEHVIRAYNEWAGNEPENKVATLASSNIYTYVGQGEDPPHMINFMGRQRFIRGDAAEVNDPDLRRKIEINPCFVKGTIDKDRLFELDEMAKMAADEQRKKDKIVNDQFKLKMKK